MERQPRCCRSFSAAPIRRLAALVGAVVAFACSNDISGPGFQQTNLVSNIEGKAPVTDSNLINPWGIAHGPNGPWAVANNGTGVSTRYDGGGNPVDNPSVITIPPPAGSPPDTPSSPTGVVFNLTTDFIVTEGAAARAHVAYGIWRHSDRGRNRHRYRSSSRGVLGTSRPIPIPIPTPIRAAVGHSR